MDAITAGGDGGVYGLLAAAAAFAISSCTVSCWPYGAEGEMEREC